MNYGYNYYGISVPKEVESDPKKRFDQAVIQAKDMQRNWYSHSEWVLLSDDGERVYIRQKYLKGE